MRLSLPLRSKEQKTRVQKYHFWQKGLWRGKGEEGTFEKREVVERLETTDGH